METLKYRREKLCTKFTVKATKHDKFSTWFQENNKNTNTRSRSTKYKIVETRTKRYKKSPIPLLTDIANSLASQSKK